jgi:hypothetical protein
MYGSLVNIFQVCASLSPCRESQGLYPLITPTRNYYYFSITLFIGGIVYIPKITAATAVTRLLRPKQGKRKPARRIYDLEQTSGPFLTFLDHEQAILEHKFYFTRVASSYPSKQSTVTTTRLGSQVRPRQRGHEKGKPRERLLVACVPFQSSLVRVAFLHDGSSFVLDGCLVRIASGGGDWEKILHHTVSASSGPGGKRGFSASTERNGTTA